MFSTYVALSWTATVMAIWFSIFIFIEIIMLFVYLFADPPYRSPKPFNLVEIEKICFRTSELDSTILEIAFLTKNENKKNPPKIIFTRQQIEIRTLSANINQNIPYNHIYKITYGRRKPLGVLNGILLFGSMIPAIIASFGPILSAKGAVATLAFFLIIDLFLIAILFKQFLKSKLIFVDFGTLNWGHVGFTAIESHKFGLSEAKSIVDFIKEKMYLYTIVKPSNIVKNSQEADKLEQNPTNHLIEVLAELHNIGMVTDTEFAKKTAEIAAENESANRENPIKSKMANISPEILENLSPPKIHKLERYLLIMDKDDIIVLHDNTVKLIKKDRWEGILASGNSDKFKLIFKDEDFNIIK